jgi:hypothetical protein
VEGLVIPGLGGLGCHMTASVDGDKDATFVRPAHTEEALPGPDNLAEDSRDEFV